MVLIDTSPAMRAATVNVLVVADSVVIPIDSSSFALLGMNQLLKTIAAISETHNPSLRILVLTSMFNKRQTRVIRIFPNEASCLRLIRAMAVETHENWIEAIRYLNMELLEDRKRELKRQAA